MPPLNGTIQTGKNKGRSYEIYQDPAQSTGYTRKQWDPNDPNKTEYFEPYNFAAAQVDDQAAQMAGANAAAAAAAQAAQASKTAADANTLGAEYVKRNERRWNEDVRQFDTGATLNRDKFNRDKEVSNRNFSEDQRVSNRDFNLKNVDTRTRMQIGLREIALKESQHGTDDLRAREKNVMDYLTTIGKLRLPYAELQALSQRAVQGIIPGGAAPGGAPGAPGAAPAGALTPDQWQALATGVNRDWEQGQIGNRASALSG